jgi:arylsulfatase A-like enzyme
VRPQPADRPVTAVLWLAAAHHPYETAYKPFPEARRVDAYDNCIATADAAIGQLVEGLDHIGRRAVVAIFGDHGEAFGEHLGDAFRGRYLYDTTIRVPFIVYAPDVVSARIDVRSRFTLKDIPATLLWLVGLDSRIGVSRPAFTRAENARIYLSTVYGDLKLGLIDEHHRKLVFRPERRRAYLYDLVADPEERHDLAASEPELVGALLEDLLRWRFWHQAELRRGPPY